MHAAANGDSTPSSQSDRAVGPSDGGSAKRRRLRFLVDEDNVLNAEIMVQHVTRRSHDAIVVEQGGRVLASRIRARVCGMIPVASTSGSNEASLLEDLGAEGALLDAAVSFGLVKTFTEDLPAGLKSLSIDDLYALVRE